MKKRSPSGSEGAPPHQARQRARTNGTANPGGPSSNRGDADDALPLEHKHFVHDTAQWLESLAPWSEATKTQVLWGVHQTIGERQRRYGHRRTGGFLVLLTAAITWLLATAGSQRAPAAMASANNTNASAMLEPADPLWRELDLGTIGQVFIRSGSAVRISPPRLGSPPELGLEIALDQGEVCAAIAHRDLATEGPLFVTTRELEVRVIGTQFCVQSTPQDSSVAVAEGRVRVRGVNGGLAEVGAGESLGSNDRRLWPTPGMPAPSVASSDETRAKAPRFAALDKAGKLARAGKAAPSLLSGALDCEGLPAANRRACLRQQAFGQDLAAETALYRLSVLDRAQGAGSVASLADLTEYRTRFPSGVFAAEAAFDTLGELVAVRRYAEAERESERYLAEDVDPSRRDEVQLLRADVLLRMSRPSEAADICRALLGRLLSAELAQRARHCERAALSLNPEAP